MKKIDPKEHKKREKALRKAMKKHHGRCVRVALELEISRRSLYQRIGLYGVNVESFR